MKWTTSFSESIAAAKQAAVSVTASATSSAASAAAASTSSSSPSSSPSSSTTAAHASGTSSSKSFASTNNSLPVATVQSPEVAPSSGINATGLRTCPGEDKSADACENKTNDDAAKKKPESEERIAASLRYQFFVRLQKDEARRAFALYTMTLERYLYERSLQQKMLEQQRRLSQGKSDTAAAARDSSTQDMQSQLKEKLVALEAEAADKVKEKLAKVETSIEKFWKTTRATLKVADELQRKPSPLASSVPAVLDPVPRQVTEPESVVSSDSASSRVVDTPNKDRDAVVSLTITPVIVSPPTPANSSSRLTCDEVKEDMVDFTSGVQSPSLPSSAETPEKTVPTNLDGDTGVAETAGGGEGKEKEKEVENLAVVQKEKKVENVSVVESSSSVMSDIMLADEEEGGCRKPSGTQNLEQKQQLTGLLEYYLYPSEYFPPAYFSNFVNPLNKSSSSAITVASASVSALKNTKLKATSAGSDSTAASSVVSPNSHITNETAHSSGLRSSVSLRGSRTGRESGNCGRTNILGRTSIGDRLASGQINEGETTLASSEGSGEHKGESVPNASFLVTPAGRGSPSDRGNEDGFVVAPSPVSVGRGSSPRSTGVERKCVTASQARRSSASVTVTSTPLHEAARIGDPRLLGRMLMHPMVDLSLRDWKKRTLLHLLCGGITQTEIDLLREEQIDVKRQKEIIAARPVLRATSGDEEKVGDTSGTSSSALDSKDGGTAIENIAPGIPSFYYCTMQQRKQREAAARKSPKDLIRQMISSVDERGGKVSSFFSSMKDKAARLQKKECSVVSTGGNSNDISAKKQTSMVFDANSEGKQEGKVPRNEATRDSASLAVAVAETTTGERQERWDKLDKLASDRSFCVQTILDIVTRADNEEQKVSLNSVDMRNRTCLHYAAELGRATTVRALLEHGTAMVTIVDENGLTACELASNGGHKDLAALLEAWAVFERDDGTTHHFDGATAVALAVAESMESMEAATDAGTRGKDDVDNSAGDRGSHTHTRCASLVPPFSWYKTLNMTLVGEERCNRIKMARSLLPECFPAGVESVEEKRLSGANEGEKVVGSFVGGGDAGDGDSDGECEIDGDVQVMTETLPISGKTDQILPSLWTDAQLSTLLDSYGWDVSKFVDDVRLRQRLFLAKFTDVWSMAPHSPAAEEAPEEDDSMIKEKKESNEGGIAEPSLSMCLICCDDFSVSDSKWMTLSQCHHGFCSSCLHDYISTSYVNPSTRGGHARGLRVVCPHHQCNMVLSESEIRSLVSKEDYDVLEANENELFVVAASDFKFCPHPSCGGVVQRTVPPFLKENFGSECIDEVGATCTNVGESHLSVDISPSPKTYEGVADEVYFSFDADTQPHSAHRFCFSCGAVPPHWPVTCTVMDKWRAKIAEEMGSIIGNDKAESDSAVVGNGNEEKFEDVAHRLWIKANTRPCPKCKTPIEKNEGCNHMTCTNRHCRYEFCWICRKDWSLHNTRTGGYFRCNRWQEDDDVDEFVDKDALSKERGENTGSSMYSARMARRKAKEMARFIHHYSRWTAHKESATLEKRMATTYVSRLAPVVKEATKFTEGELDMGDQGLSFVHAAFMELLECRSFLQHSYAFAFFRYPRASSLPSYRVRVARESEKVTFEALQSELELLTEQMSDIVARSHLRATRTQIIFLTSAAAEKRRELSNQVIAINHDEKRRSKKKKKKKKDCSENESKIATAVPRDPEASLLDSDNNVSAAARPEQHGVAGDISVELAEVLGRLVRLGRGENLRQSAVDDSEEELGSASNPLLQPLAQVEGDGSEEEVGEEEADRQLADSQLDFLDRTEEDQFRRAVEASIRSQVALEESRSMDSGDDIAAEENDGFFSEWSCRACTYHNSGGNRCTMCATRRTDDE